MFLFWGRQKGPPEAIPEDMQFSFTSFTSSFCWYFACRPLLWSVEEFNNHALIQPAESTYGTAKEKGTGLGLMLCKNFASLMGGKITLESKQGEGSCFSVSLKIAAV